MLTSEKLKELREYLGLPKSQFGAQLGYSATHIRRLEDNTASVSSSLVERICDAFHVDARYVASIVKSGRFST